MVIIPAIDLKGGNCVRLRQGRADDSKVYSQDPVAMARHWEEQGGKYLHVVDLDGAFQGAPAHTEVIAKIAAAVSMPVEVGGGLRAEDDIARLVECGVDRCIVGTKAFEDADTLRAMIDRFGRHVAVGIDARDGFVQVKGWVETTGTRAVDLAQQVDEMGAATIIYTDTATDGMLTGTNVPAMAEMCDAVSCGVIASGGISSAEDIAKLRDLERINLVGAIVGKALYEGAVSLGELNALV